MSQQQAGHTITDIYKGVINDVVSQVKEAFLDDNVDIDVLQQLKKEWEEKLIAGNSIDWDGTRQVAPPPLRQVKQPVMTSTNMPPSNTVRFSQNGQPILVQQSTGSSSSQSTLVMQTNSASKSQRPAHQVQYISATNLPISTDPNTVVLQPMSQSTTPQLTALSPGMITFPAGQSQARIIQQGGQQFLMHGAGTGSFPTGSSVMILNAGSQIPVTVSNTAVYQSTNRQPVQSGQANSKQENSIPMLDGATNLTDGGDNNTSVPSCFRKNDKSIKRHSLKNKGSWKKLVQLDGATRVSESSSDEDDIDDEDDDDPLRTIADRISDEGNTVEDEEQVVEEDPLNSGDDQSDDEDVERLFEAENLVMCQFEKVHRARSKWKFTLKDGIMHIRGKDHCFQRCSGEAEW